MAEAFYERLSEEASREVEEMELGMMFCEFIDAFKAVYVDVRKMTLLDAPTNGKQYCCNFDDASALLNEYNMFANLKQTLDECQELIKDQTQAWDLDCLLVKPVQRILKYPLLLKELLATIDTRHPDYAMLQTANQRMTVVASAINEGKRRKELVEKWFQKYKRELIFGRYKAEKSGRRSTTVLNRLNWRSTRKKTMRLNQKLFHNSRGDRRDYQEFHRSENRVRQMEQVCF